VIRQVLLVDDDRKILLSLKAGLETFSEEFRVVTASDGASALERMGKTPVSVLVSDIRMPGMDGLTLLSRCAETYPEVPVILMTAYPHPVYQDKAKSAGVWKYITKPFRVEDLAREIQRTFKREADGGTLHGVSSGMFLQLIEMEQKTCTIRIADSRNEKQGVLYFRDGDLLDARINGLKGEKAAHEIFSWDEVTLSIQNGCPLTEKRIQGELQAILLEAMRLKDEARQTTHSSTGPEDEGDPKQRQENSSPPHRADGPGENRRDESLKEIIQDLGLDPFRKDSTWDGLLAQMARIGTFFEAGRLRLCYINREEAKDYILLPKKETMLFFVSPKSPREKIMKRLSDVDE
jgi:CheY-like chemotaxis protein